MNEAAIGRRTFLAGAAALTASGALQPGEGRAQTPVPNSLGTEPAKVKAPANAADCHMHIYDPALCRVWPGPGEAEKCRRAGLSAAPEAHRNDAGRGGDAAQLRDR